MSTPSDDPPNENHPPNPGLTVNHDQRDAKVETEKEISPTSLFVNSEPIREEQVQNAVRFLSHPKVTGSPVIYRRSFLEKKGLTKEEIDEAFREKGSPDTTPAVTTTSVSNQDGQMKSSLNIQQQPQAQMLQSTRVGHMGSISKVGMLYRFRWYHGLYAISCLTASGVVAAILFKRLVVPKLKSWIRWIVLEEDDKGLMKKTDAKSSIAEEAAAAAMAAADVARASQEMMMTKSEEKRCMEELISTLHVQANEMKSLCSAIYKLEVGHNINGKIAVEEQDNKRISVTSSAQPYTNGKTDFDSHSVRSVSPPTTVVEEQDNKRISVTSSAQPYTNGKTDFDSHSVRSVSLPTTVEPSAAPHPKSYMEIMAMIQRGEKPSNIREINDAPPNPNQPLPNPRLPWEVSQTQTNPVDSFPIQQSNNGATSEFLDDQLNGDSNVAPWWQRKNPRITEIETVDEAKFVTNSLSTEQPVKRSSWVPPQPPPVAMPEAAAAIRHQKKASFQTELSADGLQSGDANHVTDEFQQSTEISELGLSSVQANGDKFEVSLNENLMQDKREALEA